ncbi:MAG TPA: sulfate adenylyltransferase subunit CysD [Planctomycetota bacterium]|nr:sulfate adenylyltransferase subunit CysD [Planctomycetota bacterium]
MDDLDRLESQSVHVIREAYVRFRRLGVLWSVGKDSTTLLWLCRKAFLGHVPLPVIHIDTGYKFLEMYSFRDRLAREWGLNLVVASNEAARAAGVGPGKGSKLACCTALKTDALKVALRDLGLDAILLGIRRDEHGIRAKERYFSPRDSGFKWDYQNQPAELWDQYASRADEGRHLRIHPLLHMTELDVWRYVRREGLPINPLYFARNGKRYRSLGCVTCCQPVESVAANVDEIIEELRTSNVSERSGRAQDKEDAYTMQKLRALGYM